MGSRRLAECRAAVARAAQTFDACAAEIAAGTRPLTDLVGELSNVVAVAESERRNLSPQVVRP